MAKKWQVSLDEKVLGHYAGHTPEEAVGKAKLAHLDTTNFPCNSIFKVHKAGIATPEIFEVIG